MVMPILVTIAIVSGFVFGYLQVKVLINIMMLGLFTVAGFLGFAFGTWGLSYALWMIFASCVLGQVFYVLGLSYSKV